MIIFEPLYYRTGVSGELRFSNQTGLFEGWENTSRPLAGIYSSDRKTKVTAGTANDLNFVTNNVLAMDIDPTRTRANSLLVSNNLNFYNNTIAATSLNSDVNLFGSGTAQTVIDDLAFIGDEIRNYSNNPLVIAGTPTGHVKMDSPTALAMPTGTTAERPLSPEIGMMRYNTELSITEVFNGVDFVGLAGTSTAISKDAIQELNEIYSLILG